MTTGLYVQPIGTTRDAKNLIEGTTVYQCFQKGYLTHSAKTERGALVWLSENGGGTYKNALHAFKFEVKPNEYR